MDISQRPPADITHVISAATSIGGSDNYYNYY